MSQNPDRNTAERLEEARSRTSTMLAVAAALGAPIGPEEIRNAALIPLPPVAEFFAVMLAHCALENFEAVARILALEANHLSGPLRWLPDRP